MATVGYGDISAVTNFGQYVTYIVVICGNLIYGALLISLIVNWIKKRDENNGELDKNISNYFSQFKSGSITINELENKVNNYIKKGDKWKH